MGSNPVVVAKISVTAPVSSKDFLVIQAIECTFTLKRECDIRQGFP